MSFLNPTWLWGLLALGIPLAIHLLSRKEGRVLRVGSLRFLQDSPTRQFKSIRLNELFLLALRMLLIILLVGLLAQFVFPDSSRKPWILTDQRAVNSALAKPIIDSLTQSGYEWRLFTKDFPLHDKPHESASLSTWSLINDLKRESFSTAAILTTGRMTDFAGLRTALPSGVSWINIPEDPDQFLLSAISSGDSLSLRVGSTSALETSFKNISATNNGQPYYKLENDSMLIEPADTLRVFVQSEKKFEYDELLLRAALKSIQDSGHRLKVTSYSASKTLVKVDWLIWLSDKPVPELPPGSHVINYKLSTAPLLVRQNQMIWTLSKRLTEELCLQEQFTLKLMSVLFAPNNETVRVAHINDRRILPEKLMWSASKDQSDSNQEPTAGLASTDSYIIILLLTVWMVERWVSYRRNQ